MTIDHIVLADIFQQPLQFRQVRTSAPIDAVRRSCGRMARALVFEQLAAEQWRAKRVFAHA